MSIHPTAVIDPSAKIGRDVEVGAFSVIGPDVVLGDGCKIRNHVTIDGHTTLGARCEVFPQAVLGLPPQDIKYRGERTTLEIGNDNVFREMVTVHPGTENGGGETRIGDRNLLLIGVHIAHDCRIGNDCIMANYVQFAGHVHVEDNVNMGGHSAVHHFATIGKHAFVGGMTRITADVPPFMVVVAARGTRSEIRMVNGVGLQRSGYDNQDIAELKKTFMRLFSRRARMDGSAIRDRILDILNAEPVNEHVGYLCRFLLRSFDKGRHGRYLESLRNDEVHRKTWSTQSEFTLTVHVEGKGRVDDVPASQKSVSRIVRELTARPEPGWVFAGWDGGLSGSDNPQHLVLDADKAVTAVFHNGSST
ncbi:MAG: acyl-ACP--UDP-N-acetylglucosamine O-acyltransferase [Phycisphaerae bacterium]